MTLPKVERVIYEVNPLDRVICQLRFPPILRIDNEVPSAFQEKLREGFPYYSENVEVIREIEFNPQKREQSISLQATDKTSSHKNHKFISDKGDWIINLTRTFISITALNYRKWEEFYEMFQGPLNAFFNIYTPSFFTRIGLRYIDIFTRSLLGLADSPWEELLEESFIGILSSPLGEDVMNCESVYEIKLEDHRSSLRLKTGFVQNMKLQEQCYLVDSDFFTMGITKMDNHQDVLKFLHDQSTRLIQFIITDKLHEALKPTKIQ